MPGTVGHGDFGALDLAGSASPRSWRTASVIRDVPYMPGWVKESPPPFVFMGRGPARTEAHSVANGPPSPLAQKPRSSRCRRAVMVKLS